MAPPPSPLLCVRASSKRGFHRFSGGEEERVLDDNGKREKEWPQPPRVPLVEGPMPSEERGKFGLCVP